jgi:hypothetical protein
VKPPAWWSAALTVTATAAALLARAAPTGVGPYAMTAALFIAAAAAFCAAAADRKPHLLATAAALAAGAGIACGISAGTLRWPSSDASWVFAASYAWLAAQTAHLTVAARTQGGPIRGAQTFPAGIVVYGSAASSCAWMRPDGTVGAWAGPPGIRGAALAAWVLLREGFLRPLFRLRKPRLFSVRRLHAAEHLAVLAAMKGQTPEPASLCGSPITPLCGGTIAGIALPLYLLASAAAPKTSHAMALLWATCAAYAVRTAALPSRRARWLLLPGLWLQRLTTAPPGEAELEVASRAVAACLSIAE